MFQTLVELIRYGSILSPVIPLLTYLLIVLLITLKRTPDFIHVVALLSIISFGFDLCAAVFKSEEISTIQLFNLYDPVLFVFTSIIYYLVFFKERKRIIYIIGVLLYITLFVIISLFVQKSNEYQNYIWSIQCLIVIVFGVLYTNHLLTSALTPQAQLTSRLWINGANLFFFSFSFWLFVMADILLMEMPKQTADMVWSFHNFNNIVKNIFFAVGIYYASILEEQPHELFSK